MDYDLSLDQHFSWKNADDALKAFEKEEITKDEYLAGLFFHPDPYLFNNELKRLEPLANVDSSI